MRDFQRRHVIQDDIRNKLWESHQKLVFWWAGRLASRFKLTQNELIGIMYLKFVRCAKLYDPTKGSFTTYFSFRLALFTNRLLRYESEFNKLNIDSRGYYRELFQQVETIPDRSYQINNNFEETIEGLRSLDKEILRLKFVYDMNLTEIGKVLGLSRQRVFQLYSKALGRLKRDTQREISKG